MSVLIPLLLSALLLINATGVGVLLLRIKDGDSVKISFAATLGLAVLVTSGLIAYPLQIPLFYCWIVWGTAGSFGIKTFWRVISKSLLGLGRDFSNLGPLFGMTLLLAGLARVMLLDPLRLNMADDDLAYIPAALKLFFTGSYYEPLSARRGASYGGQLVLQGLPTFLGGLTGYQAVELILAPCLCMLVLVEHGRAIFGPRYASVIGAVIILQSAPLINFASYFTGVPFLFYIYQIVAKEGGEGHELRPWHLTVLVVAFSSLRATYFAWSIVFAGLCIAIKLCKTDALPFTRRGMLASICGAALLGLLPAMDMWRCIGTPFFPIFEGYLDKSLNTFTGRVDALQYAINVFQETQLDLILPCFIFLLLRSKLGGRAIFVYSTIVVCVAAAISEQQTPLNVGRYLFPLLLMTKILILSSALQHYSAIRVGSMAFSPSVFGRWLARTAAFLVLFCAWGILIRGVAAPGSHPALPDFDLVARGLSASGAQRELSLKLTDAILEKLPRDGVTLLAIPFPSTSTIDYSQIYLLDIPGFMQPKTCKLNFADVEGTLACLRRLDFKYLVLQSPAKPDVGGIYSQSYWQAVSVAGWDKWLLFLPNWKTRFLEFFAFVDYLSVSRGVVAQEGPFFIVDITRL